MALSSPNLTAFGPWGFLWLLLRTWKHKVTEVLLRSDTHTRRERWWQVTDLQEIRKNNELMMTHWRHKLPCWLSQGFTHTNSYIFYGIKNLNRHTVYKSCCWKASLLCTASTYSHTDLIVFFSFPPTCFPQIHTHTHTVSHKYKSLHKLKRGWYSELFTLHTLQVACPLCYKITFSILNDKAYTRVITITMEACREHWCVYPLSHYTAPNHSQRGSECRFETCLPFICCKSWINM